MTDADPVTLLREAARLMRERAAIAKDLTDDGHGEWFPWGVVQDTKWEPWPEPQPVLDDGPFGTGETVLCDGRYEPTGQAFVSHPRWAHDQEEAWHECEFIAGPVPEPVAEFIAGMHPGVALAVAGWLAVEAEIAASRLPDVSGSIYPALAVARAYLGVPDDQPAT